MTGQWFHAYFKALKRAWQCRESDGIGQGGFVGVYMEVFWVGLPSAFWRLCCRLLQKRASSDLSYPGSSQMLGLTLL